MTSLVEGLTFRHGVVQKFGRRLLSRNHSKDIDLLPLVMEGMAVEDMAPKRGQGQDIPPLQDTVLRAKITLLIMHPTIKANTLSNRPANRIRTHYSDMSQVTKTKSPHLSSLVDLALLRHDLITPYLFHVPLTHIVSQLHRLFTTQIRQVFHVSDSGLVQECRH